MSSLKIVQGAKPGAESRGPEAGIQSVNQPEHLNREPDKTFAHDNTPARQREFESQGHQARAAVEGHADQQSGNIHLLPSDTLKLNFQTGLSQGKPAAAGDLRSNTLGSAGWALEQAVRSVNDQFRTVDHQGQRLLPELARDADNNPARLIFATNSALENRLAQGLEPETATRETISNVVSINQIDKYFSLLAKQGGEPVRQAYRATMEFLMDQGSRGQYDRLRFATDLLRDLQGGLFLYREDLEGPFPLTGRARIVNEMIALMRTLDAIEAFENARAGNGDSDLLALLTGPGLAGGELTALLERLLAESRPMLPGLAGRLEIPRLVAALGGLLNDAEGNPLLIVEGKPLKAGDLLWLNTLATNTAWATDRSGSRLSPAFGYGFDSVFSLIGFDGRALVLPRFLAIQSQVNAFEFDWVFSEAPLSEAWVRSAIELLKDSRIFDHNVLGEMLEEALTAGRFHMAVMRGTVEDGQAVRGSGSLSRAYNLGS